MTQCSSTLEFIYDESGNPLIMIYAGTPYYYVTNQMGDVVKLVNSAGTMVAEYSYNAWGEHISSGGSMASINPLRYRGYYFDEETGLYYLNSRYYDAKTGRFINADGYTGTGQGIIGNNMFAYCGNNPVNRVDPTGQFWDSIVGFFTETVNQVGQAIKSVAPIVQGLFAATAIDGPLPYVDLAALIGATIVTASYITYEIFQGAAQAAKNTPRARTGAKSKVEDITPVLTEDTVIYRYGETNPGNLTPRQRDVDMFRINGMGLSFSTSPKPGAAMTTIGAINATGIVYAVADNVGHVSIHPIGGTLDDWHAAGSGLIWTTAVKSVCVKWDGGS